MLNRPESANPIIRITKNRRLFRLALLVAVILVISATSSTNSDGTVSNSSKIQHEVGAIIFLVLTGLQAFQTLILAKMEIECAFTSYFKIYIYNISDTLGIQ